jgi:amino acid transporter
MFTFEVWVDGYGGINMSRRHERETKRLNERSMRRAIVTSVIIVGLLYWWLAQSIPPHAAWH